MLFVFGDVERDVSRRELRRAGGVVAIEPLAFYVLAALVAHRERMLSRSELLDIVWGNRVVSDSAFCMKTLAWLAYLPSAH